MGLALLVVAGNASAQHAGELEGQRGLYVWESADSLHVHWITAQARSGVLRVTARGETQDFTSAAGEAHHVALRKPRGDSYLLAVGDASAVDALTIYQRPLAASVNRPAADSLYIFGDTHGEYESVTAVLRNAGLIDDQARWTGGRKQLVFLGDITDRGAEVTRLLWLIYRLEREAKAAGGAVDVLLGNHELMVMLGDLRYVHANEQKLARLHGISYQQILNPQRSVLGRWLVTKPPVMKVGDLLLVHGGVSSDYAGETAQTLARRMTGHFEHDLFTAHVDTTRKVRVDSAYYAEWNNFIWGPRSVFWYRGYMESDTLATELNGTLASFRADAMVVGHTPSPTIHVRYGGKLIAAHPRRPGTELLLVTGQGAQRRLHRIVADGPPQLVSRE
ncbi:MAG TPA: metallophosphoesterase [Longimicrobiales bacterium]